MSILLMTAVLCCIRIYMVEHKSPSGNQILYADLYQDGELLQTIRLDTVTSEYTFEITGEVGAANTVCVRPGRIAIISASCPDQICVKHKAISKNGESIICLPHAVYVEVISDQKNDIDN